LHVFSTFAIGGPQKRFAQIANASNALFRHHVLATDGRYAAQEFLKPGINVDFMGTVSRNGSLAIRIVRYCAQIRALRPALLVTNNWGAIEWAMAGLLSRVPHIHIEDGFGPDEADRQLLRRVLFRRLALTRSFAVVVPSRTLMTIARTTWKTPLARLRYIPNGITINRSVGEQERSHGRSETLGISGHAPVVGWVGALRKEKNAERLLRAFARLPADAILAVVGDGPERENIEGETRALGIADRVRLLGHRSGVEALLPLFDIFALSSDTEQMPLVILEAMAAGLPVASVDVGDVRATLAPENDPFVVERSEAALADALSRLMASPALRTRVGHANRARALEQYPLERMVNDYLTLFRDAVSHAAGSRESLRSKASPHFRL
jgi:glycosyltransferase involved in cell wall biosynthesis